MEAKSKKIVFIAAGAIAAGTILYFVLRKKTDLSGPITDPTSGNMANGSGTGSGNTQQNVFNASLIAEKLYNVMKEMGTDNIEIINVLKNVNAQQFVQVAQKFGKRSYNKTLGNQYNFNPFSSLPLEPLQVWLKNEVSDAQYKTLQLKYPQLT